MGKTLKLEISRETKLVSVENLQQLIVMVLSLDIASVFKVRVIHSP